MTALGCPDCGTQMRREEAPPDGGWVQVAYRCPDCHPTPGGAMTESRYLMAAEVAAIFHVDPKTIARWALEGKLPYRRTLGGHRRFPETEIRELARTFPVVPTEERR